jgi:hypothetical protein
MKLSTRFKKLQTFHKVLIVLALVIVGVGGWVAFDNRLRPLGHEMMYLGKEDYGGGLFYMDYAPTSIFYYETDITPPDLPSYFKATLKHPIEDSGDYIDVSLTGSRGDFIVSYRKSSPLFQHKKKYLTTLTQESYQIATRYLIP